MCLGILVLSWQLNFAQQIKFVCGILSCLPFCFCKAFILMHCQKLEGEKQRQLNGWLARMPTFMLTLRLVLPNTYVSVAKINITFCFYIPLVNKIWKKKHILYRVHLKSYSHLKTYTLNLCLQLLPDFTTPSNKTMNKIINKRHSEVLLCFLYIICTQI